MRELGAGAAADRMSTVFFDGLARASGVRHGPSQSRAFLTPFRTARFSESGLVDSAPTESPSLDAFASLLPSSSLGFPEAS